MPVRSLTLKSAVTHVRCTRRDRPLVTLENDRVVFRFRPPVELVTRPESNSPLITCPDCHEIVPIDENVVLVV
jgi:hypothetical protein